MAEPRWQRIDERLTAGEEMLDRLCNGSERWRMSIPAKPDTDPDLVLGAALAAGRHGLEDRDYWKARALLAEERLDDNAWQRITDDRDRLAERLTTEQEQRVRLAAQVQRVSGLPAAWEECLSYRGEECAGLHRAAAELGAVLATPDAEQPEAGQ